MIAYRHHTLGATLYIMLTDLETGKVFRFDVNTFEVEVPANRASYIIYTSEVLNTYDYQINDADLFDLPQGSYRVELFEQREVDPSVDDTPPFANGEGDWTGQHWLTLRGFMVTQGSKQVIIRLRYVGGLPVPNAKVSVLDEELLPIFVSYTNASGDLALNLDIDTYKILVASNPLWSHFPAQTLVVDDHEDVTYILTPFAPQPAPDPLLCNVYGRLETIQGSPAVGALIEITASHIGATERSGQILAVNRRISLVTDEDGRFALALHRTVNLNPHVVPEDKHYKFVCEEAGLEITFDVPDQDEADLADLIP